MNKTVDVYINQDGDRFSRMLMRVELIEERKFSSLVKLEDGNIIVRKNRDISE